MKRPRVRPATFLQKSALPLTCPGLGSADAYHHHLTTIFSEKACDPLQLLGKAVVFLSDALNEIFDFFLFAHDFLLFIFWAAGIQLSISSRRHFAEGASLFRSRFVRVEKPRDSLLAFLSLRGVAIAQSVDALNFAIRRRACSFGRG